MIDGHGGLPLRSGADQDGVHRGRTDISGRDQGFTFPDALPIAVVNDVLPTGDLCIMLIWDGPREIVIEEPGGPLTVQGDTVSLISENGIPLPLDGVGGTAVLASGLPPFTITDVVFMPEPSRWQMLAAGTALLGLLYRWRVRGLRLG